MQTLNGVETSYRKQYKLYIKGSGPAAENNTYSVVAYEQRSIPYNKAQIPSKESVQDIRHLGHIANQLPPLLDCSTGILIGRDNAHLLAPHESVIGEQNEPFAIKTVLGWTLCGGNPDIVVPHLNCLSQNMINGDEFHDIDDTRKTSQKDLNFLEMMEQGMKKTEDGSITLPLPFSEAQSPNMPNNKSQAMKRLQSLIRKLTDNPTMKEEYFNFMAEMIKNNHAEEVKEGTQRKGQIWYLPHFAVYHPKKKKLRVVFDASARFENRCLNDELLSGPDQMNSLAGILLRFRKEPVALSCDIQRMFHNFKVDPADRDFLRFLWVSSDLKTIKTYRMTVHLFGATSSPGVATFALRKVASQAAAEYPLAAKFIIDDFYVDDGITSVPTQDEAIKLIKDTTDVCKSANLRLHKFLSNDRRVLETIPEEDITSNLQGLDLYKDKLPSERTLGLEWCTETDSFIFTGNLDDRPATKRGILSSVSQIYDPLGLLAPFLLQGRVIMQQSCQEVKNWDDEVPPTLKAKWERWKEDVKNLKHVKIPRCLKPNVFGNVKRTEVHYFSDASLDGYGACAYLKILNENTQVHVALLTAKSRVVPLKGLTIPRLELQAAVEAVRLAAFVRTELQSPIDQEYFWSDSTATLGYIKNSDTQFHMFTANRVREIRQQSKPDQWFHVAGSENPADIVSRGASVTQLAKAKWYQGPDFLYDFDREHKQLNDTVLKEAIRDSPEVKKSIVLITEAIGVPYSMVAQFSNWNKAVRAIGNAKAMLQNRSFKRPQLTIQQIQSTEELIIQMEQQLHYSKEIEGLRIGEKISKRSKLVSLTPFVDEKHLLRMNSRSLSHLTFQEKHPIIVPKSVLAKLLVEHYHRKVCHQGSRPTVAALRQAGFWVVGAMSIAKSVIHNCVKCKRQRGKASEQLMGPLPKERTQPSAPFTHIGIDAFGPFEVKDRRTVLKRWGIIFTCMYSRGIHIELIDDLSADSYLQALRRFESIRGPITTIFCDGGTNFLGGRNQQERDLLMMTDSKLKSYLMDNKITYKVNSPTASHQGGVWERQIRCVRAIFNSLRGKFSQRLTTEALRTTFCEVMAAINNRPLSAISLTEKDPIITVNRLLTAKTKFTAPPPGDFESDEIYGQKMFRKSQQLAQEFWEMWNTQYLTKVEIRSRWESPCPDLKVGDLVLIIDNQEPRNQWKNGRVLAVHQGPDGMVRKVSVMVGTADLDNKGKPNAKRTILERPIQKLVYLMSPK